MYALRVLWETFWTVLGWFGQIVVAFGSYLGVGEIISKYAIYAGIIVLLTLAPFGISKRDKRNAKRAAIAIVDVTNHLKK